MQRQFDAVDRNIAAKKAIEEQILVLEGELKTLEERLGKIKDSPPVIVRQHFNERTKTYTPVYGPNPEIVTLQTRITNIKRRIAYLQEQLDKIKRSL